MRLVIHPNGTVECLYDEALELNTLGSLTIHRASHVEPDAAGQWWVDLSPVEGPALGPFTHRSAALAAEAAWIESHRLGRLT